MLTHTTTSNEQRLSHTHISTEERLTIVTEAVENGLLHTSEAVENGLPRTSESVDDEFPPPIDENERIMDPNANDVVEPELPRLERGISSSSDSDMPVSSSGSRCKRKR